MGLLSAEAIAGALVTRRLGRPVQYFPVTGSTNAVARAQAIAGAPEGLLVVADEQTAGRGRQGRSWWAPSGSSLLMSLLLRPALPAWRAGQLTMCLGLGAVEGVEAVTGLQPALKWPNDLLLDGRKLAGMLADLQTSGEQVSYAVLGLGLNVNLAFGEAPGSEPGEPFAQPPVSLQMALGRPVDRLQLLSAILLHTERWYEALLAGDSPHEAWAARLDTIGRPVKVVMANGVLRGTAVSVNPEGGLVVRDEAGAMHTIWSGDVTTLRAATGRD